MPGTRRNAMGRGLPVVTTESGTRGLGLAPGASPVCVGETEDAFAACVVRLLTDDAAWLRASRAGLRHVGRVLSAEGQQRAILNLVNVSRTPFSTPPA